MSDLDRAIWTAAYMAPMPILTALRDAVFVRSAKRMPKRKFRVASDVVVQILPRPDSELIRGSAFDCRAMVCDCADDSVLTGKDRPPASWKLDLRLMGWFLLKDLSPTESSISTGQDWTLRPYRVGFSNGEPHNDIFAVRDRLIRVMPVAFERSRPEITLKPACLFCGKRLTDPVSMARWIGPECAGTAAATTPFTVNLAA
jgi:hypothetical protein